MLKCSSAFCRCSYKRDELTERGTHPEESSQLRRENQHVIDQIMHMSDDQASLGRGRALGVNPGSPLLATSKRDYLFLNRARQASDPLSLVTNLATADGTPFIGLPLARRGRSAKTPGTSSPGRASALWRLLLGADRQNHCLAHLDSKAGRSVPVVTLIQVSFLKATVTAGACLVSGWLGRKYLQGTGFRA